MTGSILDLAKQRIVLFDGALGTELMGRGLPQGICPETWNVEHPELVKDVHRSYFEAGSDVATTNSLGGNRIKLAARGQEGRVRELNIAAARVAREAASSFPDKFVAGSLGPTGKFLRPQGEFTEEEFEAVFAEQAEALAEGGADFLIIETHYDLREALAALKGSKRVLSLPVFVTMTFNMLPRGYFTIMGNTPAQCVEALEKEGADASGTNCTLDSQDMVGLVRAFKEAASRPIIAQANSGKPVLLPDGQTSYSQVLEEYVRFIPEIIQAGAGLVGGCCGTTPDYIRRIAEIIFG